jgi:hypothetical protein
MQPTVPSCAPLVEMPPQCTIVVSDNGDVRVPAARSRHPLPPRLHRVSETPPVPVSRLRSAHPEPQPDAAPGPHARASARRSPAHAAPGAARRDGPLSGAPEPGGRDPRPLLEKQRRGGGAEGRRAAQDEHPGADQALQQPPRRVQSHGEGPPEESAEETPPQQLGQQAASGAEALVAGGQHRAPPPGAQEEEGRDGRRDRLLAPHHHHLPQVYAQSGLHRRGRPQVRKQTRESCY